MSGREHNGGPSYPIPIWNGILDHRRKIGAAVWVFLWCIDRITQEDSGIGLVLGGATITADRIAEELDDSEKTVRRHLKRLAGRYIGLKREPYGFVITVLNSCKFGIWRSDKTVRSAGDPDRTKLSGRADKNVGQTDNFVRCNKEDSAVDSAKRQTEHPPTPLKEGGIPAVWQKVCEYLKDDLSTAYVNNPHFQESAYDKYFRDAWLVEIRGDVAVLDSTQSGILREGVEKFQQRLCQTFRGVVYDVREIRVKKSEPLLWTGEESA